MTGWYEVLFGKLTKQKGLSDGIDGELSEGKAVYDS